MLGKLTHGQHHPKKKYYLIMIAINGAREIRGSVINENLIEYQEIQFSNLDFIVFKKYISFEVVNGLFNNVSGAVCSTDEIYNVILQH